MKTATLTLRLDEDTERFLAQSSKRSGKNRSEIAREAIRRQLRIERFRELRALSIPYAEAAGFFTDEDVFREVS